MQLIISAFLCAGLLFAWPAAAAAQADAQNAAEAAAGTEAALATAQSSDQSSDQSGEQSDEQSGAPAAQGDDEEPVNPLDANRIGHDPALLPEPVRETWQALVDAARSGDIEALRPLISAQPQPPIFTFGEIDDPIEHLKSLSGDPEGREILAILLEVLEIGYVRVAQGTENEMYIWPYFADIPLERLTPEQIVELFTILTAGDYQDMLSYGAYIFFRVGISPDGRWHFFVAGD